MPSVVVVALRGFMLRRRLRPLSPTGNAVISPTLSIGWQTLDCFNPYVRRRRMTTTSTGGKSSKSSDSGGKKQAMQRQRDRSPKPPETKATKHDKDSSSSSYPPPLVPSPPPKSFHAAPTRSTSTPSIMTPSGLSKLDLQPDWSRFSSSDNNHSGIISWEPNKDHSRMMLHRDDLLLRNNTNNLQDNDHLFEIDRESLFDPTIHLPHAPTDWKGYETATPLSDFLMQRIGVSGQPITTAEYMRHALTHPLYGYYTTTKSSQQGKQQDNTNDDDDDWEDDEYAKDDVDSDKQQTSLTSPIFGRGGDFVTAPELTSVFGHSLCVWFMTVWQQAPLFKPKDIQMVELGPGRGTLMADLLELAHSSKLMDFGKSIRSVHLIEASRELRQEQKETMKKALSHLIQLEFADENDKDKKDEAKDPISTSSSNDLVNTIQVVWHDDFASFQRHRDKDVPSMIIMQEFLDALPVHQFQKTEDGWRERMIDVVSAEGEDNPPLPVPSTFSNSNKRQLIPRLRQVLAPQVTPAVDLLLAPNQAQYDHFPEGTVVEICPDALVLLQDVAMVLEESRGAALIVDYGEEGTADTLRAFSKHQQVPLTSKPGMVDVTADVDFFALKNCLSGKAFLRGSSGKPDTSAVVAVKELEIQSFGPVPQGEFLMKMGAGELTMNAIEKSETTEEQAQAMADALKYLVMPEHMGTKFKVLALARKRDGLFGPAGME